MSGIGNHNFEQNKSESETYWMLSLMLEAKRNKRVGGLYEIRWENSGIKEGEQREEGKEGGRDLGEWN